MLSTRHLFIPTGSLFFRMTLVFLWWWFGGCTIIEPDKEPPAATAIQTDQTRYEAQHLELGQRSGVEVTIPMTFRNITSETVYLIGCITPNRPILQKRVDNVWVFAWGGLEDLCLSPPWSVAPGETFQDTLRLTGFWPGQNISPEFLTDVPGRYRLVRPVYQGPEPPTPLIPEEARTSNEFELTW